MRADQTIPELLVSVMKPSYESIRAQYMGWTFGEPTIRERFESQLWTLRVPFTCVCGRHEIFEQTVGDLRALCNFNAPKWLHRNGSFSRAHLESDGFTEEEIRVIEIKGEEFDRLMKDHVVVSAMRGQMDEYNARHIHELVTRDKYAG